MDSPSVGPGLGRRFVWIALVLAVLPLGAIGLWATQNARRSGRALLQSQLEAQLIRTTREVEQRWSQAHADLLMLGENEPVRLSLSGAGDDAGVAPGFVVRAFGQLTAFSRITLRDRRGVVRWTLMDRPALAASGANPPDIELTVPITDLMSGDTLGSLEASLRIAYAVPAATALASPAGPLTALFREGGSAVIPTGTDGQLFSDERVEWSGTHWLTTRRSSALPGIEIALAGPLDPFVGPFESAARRSAAALLLASGVIVLLIMTLTRRMTREVERELAQREALAAVGEFASELAHEVRNPLTAIRLDLQRVEEAAEQPEMVRGTIEGVLRQVDRMDRAVTGALRVSRGGSIEPRPVDLRDVLESALKAAEPEIVRRGGRSGLADSGKREAITGDAFALEQLFLNLLLNAAQSLGPGGTVGIRVAPVNGSVEVTITDNGKGMSPEELGRVERPYRSARPDGNGLGLKIARRVVASHRGNLTIASEPGVGTTVTVRLPLR